jgi:WG containing repeat
VGVLIRLLCLAALSPSPREATPDPIPYFKGGKWGYSDPAKNLIVSAVYDKAGRFKEGRALVQQGKGKGFIDTKGKEVIPLRYSYAEPFAGGLAAVGKPAGAGHDRYGFVDRNGNVVVPLQYDWVNSFEGGVAKVSMGQGAVQRWGFVDSRGKIVVPPTKYAYVGEYSEDLAPAYEEHTIEIERFGFVDRQGREVIPINRYWSWCHERWSEGLMAVRHKGKWGYIDHTGREVIPTMYEEAGDFEHGQGHVKLDGKDLYIDPAGRPIPAPQTRTFEADGLAEIASDNKRAWVDRKGKEAIRARYDPNPNEVCPDWPLSEGLRGVTLGGKHGFINHAGVEVIPVQYDCTGRPRDGMVPVWQGKLAGFFDLSGKQVIPFKYWKAESFEDGFALVALPVDANGRWVHGYVDKRGTEFFEGPGDY